MSGALDILQEEEDVLTFLAAGTHLGGTNLDFPMEQPIYKWKSGGVCIINLKRAWKKLLLLTAWVVSVTGNPADVSILSRNTGQYGVMSPRFDKHLWDLEKCKNNLLLSRQFGFMVLTTSAGIVDHEEAKWKHTGGKPWHPNSGVVKHKSKVSIGCEKEEKSVNKDPGGITFKSPLFKPTLLPIPLPGICDGRSL